MIASSNTAVLAHRTADTPIGLLRLSASSSGLCAVSFADEGADDDQRQANSVDPNADALVARAQKELQGYFAGEATRFAVPLDVTGTPFQRNVWRLLCRIPFGTTITYLALAEQLGDPGAVRAVARANAQNPVAIIIPCHRVIGSDGRLTGYAGGLWRKEKLLEHEARVAGRPYQSRLFE